MCTAASHSRTAPMTEVQFLLEHNATIQQLLLTRSNNPDQFDGAYYEAYVARWCPTGPAT